MLPFRVLCTIRTWLWRLVAPWNKFVQLFALRASSHCKHDMSALKYGNTQKSIHPPLWQTCKVLHPWALFCKTIVQVMVDTTVLTANMKHYKTNIQWSLECPVSVETILTWCMRCCSPELDGNPAAVLSNLNSEGSTRSHEVTNTKERQFVYSTVV